MTDLQPYAIFLGGSFLVGFVARTLVGGYRTISGKPKGETIEIEMVEAEVVPEIRNEEKKPEPIRLTENDFINLNKSAKPLEERWAINSDDEIPYIPVRPYDAASNPKVGSGSAMNPRNVAADELRKLAAEHDKREIEGNKPPLFNFMNNGSAVFRILPPAKNHEVFARHDDENGKPRYFYNVVIRKNGINNPQVLCVPESVHKKIVAAFADHNYDCADLVDGCDIVLNRLDVHSYRFEIEKGTKRHAGEPAEVEGWLKKTADLQAYIPPVNLYEQSPVTKRLHPSKKLVSFNLDEEAYDNLVSNARDNNVTPSAYLNDLLRKQVVVDEAGDRQQHFSNGEKVRLVNPQKVYDALCSVENSVKLSWSCDKNHKLLTHKNRWQNNMRPETGDCGEIVGFVMEIKDGNTVPYHSGVAVVKLRKVAHNANIFVAVAFDGLESLETAESSDQQALKVGDWVHWKTQAGHTSVRPSVVFKTRKSKGVNEVQLGYVQKSEVTRFWCPISKCQKLNGQPQGFDGLVAHQLPEAILAEKLRNI